MRPAQATENSVQWVVGTDLVIAIGHDQYRREVRDPPPDNPQSRVTSSAQWTSSITSTVGLPGAKRTSSTAVSTRVAVPAGRRVGQRPTGSPGRGPRRVQHPGSEQVVARPASTRTRPDTMRRNARTTLVLPRPGVSRYEHHRSCAAFRGGDGGVERRQLGVTLQQTRLHALIRAARRRADQLQRRCWAERVELPVITCPVVDRAGSMPCPSGRLLSVRILPARNCGQVVGGGREPVSLETRHRHVLDGSAGALQDEPIDDFSRC
jgi:hypothetical protein